MALSARPQKNVQKIKIKKIKKSQFFPKNSH